MNKNVKIALSVKNLSIQSFKSPVLKNISVDIPENEITSLIGPTDSGKTSLLQAINRMIDFSSGITIEGEIILNNGKNLLDKKIDTNALRQKIGFVSAKPAPFPLSILENIYMPMKFASKFNRSEASDKAEELLKKVGLWKRVRNNLKRKATNLTVAEAQLLSLARALAMEPEILMLDQPTAILDPIDSQNIEEVLLELQNTITILMVTHNIQQAARISSWCIFLHKGEIVESGETNHIFTRPKNEITDNYIKGKFG